MVEIAPPGTWCQTQALLEILRRCGGTRFLEVGCGGGELAERLCSAGFQGWGIDYSPQAVELARQRLQPFLNKKQYHLTQGDFSQAPPPSEPLDLALSMMVMEHIADDLSFIRKLAKFVRPGGHVVVGVPGRMDRWSLEDETVGHLRRYEREDLVALLERAGLKQVQVWSVSVPIANFLFGLGNFFVRRAGEEKKRGLSQRDQTETSGIRKIPFKTVFPAFFKLFLNQFTLYPLFVLQRLFYRSRWGLTLIAFGEVS